MKKHSTISCLAIICQLFIGINGYSQANGAGFEILQQPVFGPVCAGEGTSLKVQASGGGLSYQWQVFKRVGYFEDLTNTQGYSGVQTAHLQMPSLSKSMNQYLYRCKISNGTEELYSEPAVTELKNARINFHPANGTGYVGDYHSFEVYASGAGLKFQWQVNTGAGFANMVDDSTYTGCKTSILSISKLVKKMDGYQFRCIVSGKACEVATLVSDPASLTVSTDANPMKSMMGGNPSNVIWYINGTGGTPTFFGNPMVHVDGAIKVENNGQIRSQAGTGLSADIRLTGHLYNNNPSSRLLTNGDISQFIFEGADAQQIIGGNSTKNNFNKLRISKSSSAGKVTLFDDISIRKNLELATGDLDLLARKVYLTFVNTSNAPITLASSNLDSFPKILNETENNRIYGNTYNAFVAVENQEIASPGNPFANGPVNLGNMGAEIYDPENHFGAAQITIKRVHNTNSIVIDTGDPMNPLYMGSINRTYTIESNPDTPIPSGMDFTFRYLDGEVSGSEANLTIFKSDGSGGTWTAQSSILNTSANTLVQNDVADITKWWTAFPCTNAPYVFFYQSPETHLCDGVTYTLTPANTGGPASAYEWVLDGDTLGLNEDHYSITGVEGTPNQTLEFIAYDSLGCYDRAIVTIVHEDTLIVDIGPNLALCQGASHTFTAAYPGNWKVDGIPQGNPQIPMSSFNFIANNYSPGPHAVTIAVYLNYCNAFDTVTVTVNPTPTVEITPPYSTVCEPGTTDLTANPTGGTTPYDYNWNYGGASTQTVSVPNATTVYTVTLTDANGCTATDNMGMNFVNIILTETHTQPICFGEGLGSIDLTISTPNGCPGIIWSNGATTEDLTGLEAGTYTVTVSNASNGCTDTQYFDCSKTLSVTLVGPSAALATSGNVTNLLCHGDGNGIIDLVVTGGTLPYTYLWSNGATTQDLNMLSGGTYGVTVTDANLCTKTNSFVVAEPSILTASSSPPPLVTAVTCHGAGNGAIAWAIVGGTSPYGFSWTGPGGFTATTEDLANLDGGTYNVTVTDANNCTYSTNMTVPEPAILAAVVTPHNIGCFGDSDGYIIISNPTGGIAPFTYAWTGPNGYTSTSQNIYSLAVGSYDVTITDANGCTLVPTTQTISEPSTPLSFTATVTNVTCFGASNGIISIVATGGWGNYTYAWLDPDDNDLPPTPVINGLAPGSYYSLTLIDDNGNGCILGDQYTITEPDEIVLNETITHISCNGESDGSIYLNAMGGGGGFTYNWQWAGGSSTASFIENLSGPTQSYSVTVTDASNCTKTATFEVTEPAMITATSTVVNISCAGGSNGSINLTVAGGNPAYTFSWTGPGGFTATTEDITNLAAGAYAVTITDANSCTGPMLNFNVTAPPQLTGNPIITMPLECFGDNDGQINANPSGGTPPYTYLWTYPNNTQATTQFISNLSQVGNYSVSITDANGCNTVPAVLTIALTSPTAIATSGVVTDVSIFGDDDGAIDLTVSGGTSPYTYLWSNGPTTQDISGLTTGNYTVTVTDDNGCESTASFFVDEPALLEILLEDLSNISCNGANDGYILVYGEGGVSPYTFLWSNGDTDGEITNLAPGNYTLTLTDANGAEAIETYTITQPDPILLNAAQVNISCNGANDGSITLAPTGGTNTFSYNWSNQSNSNPVTNLAPGPYSVTVTDGNNCQVTASYTITEPDLLTTSSTATNASCYGYDDGSIALTTTGGTMPYSYNWDNGITTGSGSGNNIPDLFAGTYNITVTDDHGCTATTSATITQPPSLNVNITGTTTFCNGESSVLDAGAGFTDYDWSTGASTQTITVTSSGLYSVTVTGTGGCLESDQATVTEYPAVSAPVSGGNQSICTGETIPALTVTVGANETADWYDTATGGNLLLAGNTSYTPIAAGTYHAEARNTINSCISSSRTTVTLTINPLPTANAGGDATICSGSSTTLNASGSSGNAPLSFLWSPTTGLNNPNIMNPVANPTVTTTYTVLVTDGNGCTANDAVLVTVNSLPNANAGADVTICAGANTQLDAGSSSGNGTLSYLWSPTANLNNPNIPNPVANPLTTTTYTVLVTDGNGCTDTDPVVVTVNPQPTLLLDSTVCAPNLLSYTVFVHSNANSLSADHGTVTNNGNGTFTISGVDVNDDVTLTAIFTATGCEKILLVIAPDCPCPVVDPPISNGDQSICVGVTIPALSVTVNTNETADWYDAATGGNLLLAGNTSYTPSPSGGGGSTYFAEAHNTINNCLSSSRTAVALIINPLPTANAGPNVAICIGNSTMLDASGSTGSGTLTYLWSPTTGLSNPNIVNPVANPTATTTYMVLVTDDNGCTDTDDAMVTVNPLPTLTVLDTVCAPNLLTYSVLISTNGNTVTATLGTVTNNGGGNFTVSGVPTGQDVTVTATITATGCPASQLVISPICPCPFVDLPVSGGNQTICSNNPIPALTVTVNMDETADWYAAPTGGSPLLSGNTSYVPTAAGTYYAEARNTINQCTSAVRMAVTLTINPVPSANAGADVAICTGSNTTLNASGSNGNAPLSYQWSPSSGLSNPNIVNPVANPTATTTYTVMVTDGNGCTHTDPVVVTVNPLPTLTVNDTICAPNLLTYSVLLFTNGNTVTATLGTVTNNGGGNYTVGGVPTGSDVTITSTITATGCQRTETVVSPTCPCPAVSIPVSGGDQTICASSPIPTLTVTVGTDETADWYDMPSGGNLLLAGSTSYTPIAAGTYYAEAHNVINNCLSFTRTAVVLTINPLPVPNAGADVTICASNSTQLNAGSSSGNAPLTYLWTPATGLSNPNIVNPIASPLVTITYTVLVTDINGCSATDQVTVNVNPLPTLTVTSVACALDLQTYRVNLTTSADNVAANFGNVINYGNGLWAVINIPDGQNVVITVTNTATGCFRVQNVNAPDCSCPAVDEPVSQGDAAICTGDPIPTLEVSVGLNETADWYDAPTGGNLLLMGDTIYTPTVAGTFYVETRVTFSGCVSSIRTAVTLAINPLPSANAGADVAICVGNSTMLNAGGSSGTGVLSYSWTPIIALSNPNIANPVASPTTTRTYTVLVTDENGCTDTDAVTVTVNPLPTANAGADVAICFGNSTQLSASSNGPNSYAWSPATGLSATNIPNPIASPAATTTYTVVVTNGNGCTASDQVVVMINMLPIADAGAFAEICIGSSTQLNASGSSGNGTLGYAWSPPTGLSATNIPNPMANPIATTTYTVTVTDGNGCSASDQVTVLVNPLPVADAGADVAICLGESTTLDASGSSGSGTLSYAWSPATGLSATNIANPVAQPLDTTTYTVQVTDGNGCTQTDAVTVTVNPLPTLVIDSTICALNLFTYNVFLTSNAITVSASAGNVNNYGGGNFTVTDIPNGPNVTITATDPPTGCQVSEDVPAPFCDCSPLLPPVSNGNQVICAGAPIPALTVTVGVDETAYWWSAPVGGVLLLANSTSYTPTGAGTFYAEAHSTVSNCVSDTRTAVTLTVNPMLLANAGPNTATCTGNSAQLAASSGNGVAPFTYSWSPASSLSNPTIANPVASPTASTTYTVTVTDASGCSGTDQVLVTVNPLPTLTVNNTTCDPGLTTYHVLITTNANTVSATLGTVTSAGAGMFQISDVPTGQNIVVTATQSGTGCTKTQGISSPNCNCPTVNPPVSGGDQVVCAGAPFPALTVTVGPGETANWYDAPTGGNLLASAITTYTPTGVGSFYVETLNIGNNCTSTVRTLVTLTSSPSPTANAGADATTCGGVGVQLDASGSTGAGGLAFAWSPATGLNDANIVNPIASPLATTTYTVTVTNGAGCTSTDEVVITVATTPVITIVLTACSVDLLTYHVELTTDADLLTASAGTLTDNGGGSFTITNIPAGQDVVLTATNTTTNCVWSQTVVAPDCNCPFVAVPLSNGDQELCEGEPVHILSVTVGPGETADWYDAPTGGNLLLANNTEYLPTVTDIFYVEARNTGNGCISSSRVVLIFNVLPLPTVAFDDPGDVCAGSAPIMLTASPTGGIFDGAGVSSDQFDPITAGAGVHVLTYSFTDGNGCVAIDTQLIEVVGPTVTLGSNSPVCDGADLQLTESGGHGVAWNWTGPNGFVSTEQNPVLPLLTAAGEGVYEVTVTSAGGCVKTASTTVTLNPPLSLSLDPISATFCPGSNVELVALPTGGAGQFGYAWTAPSGGTSSAQTILADEDGTWSVVVTDGSGCTIAGTVDVAEFPAMAATFTSTDASCNGSDGTLTATVTGGLPPFSYEWDGLPNTTNMLTGVPAGGYQLMVTDANGCVFSATSLVGNAGAPVVTINGIVDVLCAGAATGSIAVNVTGGDMPYSFSWTNGNTDQNITGLTAGQYGLEVMDASGCIVNNIYQVTEPPAIVGLLVTTETTTPASSDGAIDLSISGGVPPYQFAWSNGLNSEDISNLFIGPYSVSITDANGCSVVENTTVTAVGALAVNLAAQGISCFGAGDGSVEVVISGGAMPYSILWSNGSTQPTIGNLLPGIYQVTVTDQDGATSTGSVVLAQPPLLQSFTQMTDNVCNGESAGTANVFASGGTTPYTYEWSDGQTTQAASGLLAGVYTVIVTDAHGCTNQQSVNIGEPSAIEIAIDAVTANDCFGDMEGTIDISVTGGVFPYFANWSQGASTQDIGGLAAGTYVVTMTDFTGCTNMASVVVGEAPEIIVAFTIVDVACFGEANGSLTANASGGTPGTMGYEFLWDNGQAIATIDNLASGNYFLTVTDELGCTTATNDYLAQPDLLLGNLTAENISCFGLSNGSAVVQPTGGTMPYTYLWATNEVDSLLEDLDIGNYSVVITDANGCSTTEATQITQPDLLTAVATVTDLNCFNDFSGAIDLTVSGGTPTYDITWNSGQFTEDIDQLAAGDYILNGLDGNGCVVMDTITVAQPDAILAVPEINNISCYGGNDGAINLTVSGGNSPYIFNWQNGATTPGITGLPIGIYAPTITDNNGCTLTSDIELTQPTFVSVAYQIQRAGCKTDHDGHINLTVEGGVPAYTFNWSNGAVSENVSQLTAGTYTVTVMDDNGCTMSQSLGVASTGGTFEAHFLAASGLFDVDSVEVNSDDIIQFVDVSQPTPLSWEWQFGDPDSTTSGLPNPAFSYPNDNTVAQSSYMATLIATNLFCTDTMTKQIWITNNFRLNGPGEDSLGYLTFTDILAYPNPTAGMVTLDIKLSREEKVRLYVVDVLGKILEQNELEGDDHYTTKLDFTDFLPGIYFINLRSVNQVHTVKIVVSDE